GPGARRPPGQGDRVRARRRRTGSDRGLGRPEPECRRRLARPLRCRRAPRRLERERRANPALLDAVAGGGPLPRRLGGLAEITAVPQGRAARTGVRPLYAVAPIALLLELPASLPAERPSRP